MDADSGDATEATAFVSELQRAHDASARDAAAQLAASRAGLLDERQRSLRVHDALHAQLREVVAQRDGFADRLRAALAERAALRDELRAADGQLRPVLAVRESHAALLAKLGALKGEGEWDFERARLRADETARENSELRRAAAELRAELASVVAWRRTQAARGEAPVDEMRALASLQAQNKELRRLQYESERERSALKARVYALEEEVARLGAYIESSRGAAARGAGSGGGGAPAAGEYQREIDSLRAQLEQRDGGVPPPSPSPRGARAQQAGAPHAGFSSMTPSLPTVQRRVPSSSAAHVAPLLSPRVAERDGDDRAGARAPSDADGAAGSGARVVGLGALAPSLPTVQRVQRPSSGGAAPDVV